VNNFGLVRKNLFRRKLRTWLMIVSIFIAFMIFGVLAGFYRAFNAGEDRGAADRLITFNKISFTQTLPLAYYDRLSAIDGVRQATHVNWAGGYYQDPKDPLVSFAVDPVNYFDVYDHDFDISEDVKQTFIRERTGAVIGEALARNRGWKIGDHIPVKSNIYALHSGSWDLTVVGIFKPKSDQIDTNFLLFHYGYFNETLTFGKDAIGWLIFKTRSSADNDHVAKAIDAMFANSSAETTTDTEKALGKAFAAQFGNIALIVLFVVGAAFVTILMIVGNTMALTVRERIREIGVLKTLGFSGARILWLILSESVLLALLGGLPGLAVAAVIAIGLRKTLSNIAPTFAVSSDIMVVGVGLMVALGLITGVVPALTAMRFKIATALGRG
jgi:putative ABC transport system permease protein